MEERFQMFTILIAKISRSIRRIKTEEMEEFNLKSPHVSCLYYLYRQNGTLTSKELCDICDEDKASISRSIDYLEKNKFISCDSNAEKRYNAHLFLTDKGKEVGKIITQKIDHIVNLASRGLNEEKRTIFYECLNLISNNLIQFCDEKYSK